MGLFERIQVNRELIGESDVVRLVAELRAPSSEFPLQAAPGLQTWMPIPLSSSSSP